MQYDENAEKYGYEGEMTPLKCDNLTAYKGDVTIPVYGTIADAEVYLKKDVDKTLAEKDKEIALLKERICNGDVSRLTWIDDCIAKDKEIEELKQKLENVQASMYADVVDANMENRRLKRTLWIARAERAKTEHLSKIMYSTLYRDFITKWVNVERKCRAKAEEYK